MAMQRRTCAAAILAIAGISTILIQNTPLLASDTNSSLREGAVVIISMAKVAIEHVQILIGDGYRAAPALMLGLTLLVALPVMAVIAQSVIHLRRDSEATRRFRSGASKDVSSRITGADADKGRTKSAHAFVEVVGVTANRFAILHDMLRIGREDDNDIRIPSQAVHRYHAAIYREDRDDWHIADLSGVDGNGIRVNGQRCSDARLRDGDIIDLGAGQLRFRAAMHNRVT
jgi:FHA domain